MRVKIELINELRTWKDTDLRVVYSTFINRKEEIEFKICHNFAQLIYGQYEINNFMIQNLLVNYNNFLYKINDLGNKIISLEELFKILQITNEIIAHIYLSNSKGAKN